MNDTADWIWGGKKDNEWVIVNYMFELIVPHKSVSRHRDIEVWQLIIFANVEKELAFETIFPPPQCCVKQKQLR